MFLPQRELTVTEEGVEPLMGVALIHESIEKNTELKVFLQIVLIFRLVNCKVQTQDHFKVNTRSIFKLGFGETFGIF